MKLTIYLEGFNWMTTFQQNMGMDLQSDSRAMGNLHQQPNMQANVNAHHNLHPNMFDSRMNYLTGPR